jgi:hypothetical protein
MESNGPIGHFEDFTPKRQRYEHHLQQKLDFFSSSTERGNMGI